MLRADENHPIWDMLDKYKQHFGNENMIGTLNTVLTGDELMPIVEKAIKDDTPISYDNEYVYPPLPDGYEI